jgi:hypothetical protein
LNYRKVREKIPRFARQPERKGNREELSAHIGKLNLFKFFLSVDNCLKLEHVPTVCF